MVWISVLSSQCGECVQCTWVRLWIPERSRRVPTNVMFEIDDLTQEWTYPSNFFDFIHVRTLGGSIKDWPSFLSEAIELVIAYNWSSPPPVD